MRTQKIINGQLQLIEAVVRTTNDETVYRNMLNERIVRYGTTTSGLEELIYIITGIPLIKCRQFLEEYGFIEMIQYTSAMQLTKMQKLKLEVLFQLHKLLSTGAYKDKVVLDSSSRTGQHFIHSLKFYDVEVLLLALLNTQNKVINTIELSKGTVNEAPIYPREVLKHVIVNNASSIILAHNHPGGSLNPSSSDIEATKRIAEALKTINVKLVDHIIVADGEYVSFAEKGILP